MESIRFKEKNLRKRKIKGQLYKHTHKISSFLLTFERSFLLKILKGSEKMPESKINMYHLLDRKKKEEIFIYKTKGALFAYFKGEVLPLEYLQLLKIKLTLSI